MKGSALSFEVDVRSLPKSGHPVLYQATKEECAALAELNGLLEVRSFAIDAVVEKWRSDGVRVRGRVTTDIVQECVVTLEPVPAHLDFPVEGTFIREGSKLETGPVAEMIVDPDGDDPPETFDGTKVDVGALASELFSLALDPYPRLEGAELPKDVAEGDSSNPFAALAALKNDVR